MRILSVDPGPHVGLALWNDQMGLRPAAEFDTFTYWQEWESTPEDFLPVADKWIETVHAVVCEKFLIAGPRAKEANITIEMIGVLRYLCTLASVPFVEQAPSDRNFATPAKLKHLGWYVPGSDHARSATQHLVTYLVKTGMLTPSDVLPSS